MRNEVLWNKEAHRTLWQSPPTPTNFKLISSKFNHIYSKWYNVNELGLLR